MEVYTADTNFVENSAEKLKQRKISRKKNSFNECHSIYAASKSTKHAKKKQNLWQLLQQVPIESNYPSIYQVNESN